MRKILTSVFTLTLLFDSSLVLAGNQQNQIRRSENYDIPICYHINSDGKIVNLTRICGFIKPQSCSTSLGSASRDRVLNQFCQQNEKCLLTNTCNAQPIAPYGPRPGEAAG